MSRRADVAVIGSGPAGLGAAIRSRSHGQSVLLIDDGRRRRLPCETVGPDVQRELEALGVPKSVVESAAQPCHGIEATWGGDTPRFHSTITNPHGHGWHLDRPAFLESLRAFACSIGVTRVEGRCDQVVRSSAGWHVRITSEREPPVVSARFVVDATGRASSVVRTLGVGREADQSLVAIFATMTGNLRGSQLLVEASRYGWWYAAPAKGGPLFALVSEGAILSRLGASDPTTWLALIRRTRIFEQHQGPAIEATDLAAESCGGSRLSESAGDGWIACGDASVAFDPLSSAGVLHALRSGRLAADALSKHLAGDAAALGAYDRARRRDYRAYVEQRAQEYAREARWLDEPFWRSAHQDATARKSGRMSPTY